MGKFKITDFSKLEIYDHPIETRGRINSLNGELDDIKITGEGYLYGQKVFTTYYKGIKCTSIFNPFVGCYYTDDKYGQIEMDSKKEEYTFTCRDDYKDYAESMLHDSGEEVARVEDADGKYRLTLDIYGNKDVVYKREHYRYTQDFPDKLIELFKEGEVDSDFDTTIVENNWLDITFYKKTPNIFGGDNCEYVDDMVFEEDLAAMSKEQLKDYMITKLLEYKEAYPEDDGDDDNNNEEGGGEMDNEYNKHVQKYVVLKDMCEDTVDAIILYETSTVEEIQRCIDEMKENIPDYQWEDLIDCLPEDCVVYDRFSGEELYY